MKILQIHNHYSGTAIFMVLFILMSLGFITVKQDKRSYLDPGAKEMPLYGEWKHFTVKDGLPSDKTYCVLIDNDRILVGTHYGLAVYQDEKWITYTTKDGLAHNGVLSLAQNELTGDIWIGTMGGLSRWSAGKFENFNQMNSGMPNDLIYSVACDGKDVWVATGGGAGKYDSYTKEWEIYTEENAPMHEPWTYGICTGDDKIFIAAWGGGIVEYNKKRPNSEITRILTETWRSTCFRTMALYMILQLVHPGLKVCFG